MARTHAMFLSKIAITFQRAPRSGVISVEQQGSCERRNPAEKRKPTVMSAVFNCVRFMELAEIGRCRASLSPPQTHQGGQLSSMGMAVAVVCWGCPRCSARWGDTSVSVCGCAAASERASERRTSERASGKRATERRANERASGAQQTVTHSDTSASVCGSQRASEQRAESERASKQRAGERAESERASERRKTNQCVGVCTDQQ